MISDFGVGHLFAITIVLASCTASANNDFCSQQSNGFKSDPEDCSKFYRCSNNVAHHFQCANGLHFNPRVSGCDWPQNAQCNSIKTESTTQVTPLVTTDPTTTAHSSSTAAPETSTSTPDPSTKTTELLSTTTTQTTTTTVEQTTESKTEVTSPEQSSSTASTEQISTDSVTSGPKTEPPTAEEFCRNKPSGYYKHPVSCSKYYQCYNGGALLLLCMPGLQFNVDISVCDWAVNVNCDNDGSAPVTQATTTTTTTATETTSPSACNNNNCVAPACYCPTTSIPLNLPKADIPQIVMVTFDDAVTTVVDVFFNQIFHQNRLNPNGCPATGTYFLSDHYTDYNIIRRLSNEGHEIADHSCNHTGPNTKQEWEHEIICQKNKINTELNSNENVVKGWRSPFLRMGGNTLFNILKENNFIYDSSISFGFNNQPTWPFTLDIPYQGPCNIPPCPTGSFPGFFEIPLLAYKDKAGYECSMFDGCSSPPSNVQEAFELFKNNFHRHYDTNKAPFPVFGHAAYFVANSHRLLGFLQFLDYLKQYNDVYIVSVSQAVEWMKNPTRLNDISTFEPWSC